MLFAYPPQAAVNRVLPKTKVYANATIPAKLREAFVSDLHQITWRYKLAPETVRLAATPEVPEIQVFELALKGPTLNEEVARTIDRAIPFPIVFELTFADQVKALAAWKRPLESNPGTWTTNHYLATPWMPADSPRETLPVALDMGGLYEHILRALVPHPPRRGEALKDHMERLAHVRALETEFERLEQRLDREKQFNRKIEINARLRAIKDDIAALTCRRDD